MIIKMSSEFDSKSLDRQLSKWNGYSTIQSLLEDETNKIYLAGGALRNNIAAKREIKDYDFFALSKHKEATIDFLSKHGTLAFGPFGSARWLPKNEISTYCDFIWIDEFYNGLWYSNNIVDVLNQFDFTANAIGLDLRTQELFDPQNGIRDLSMGIMRAVRFDYPNEPISSHSNITRLEVLWFRIQYYSIKYQLKIEPVTRNWIDNNYIHKQKKDEFEKLFFKLNF